MERKGISPLLAAVILAALTISVAFIINAAISGMVQRQAATTEETAQVSGALLQVDLDSLTCTKNPNTSLQMVLRLTGTTKPAKGLTVIMKDSAGNLLLYSSEDVTINPGITIVNITFDVNATKGEVSYLSVSTMNPPIPASYDNETYEKIVECE